MLCLLVRGGGGRGVQHVLRSTAAATTTTIAATRHVGLFQTHVRAVATAPALSNKKRIKKSKPKAKVVAKSGKKRTKSVRSAGQKQAGITRTVDEVAQDDENAVNSRGNIEDTANDNEESDQDDEANQASQSDEDGSDAEPPFPAKELPPALSPDLLKHLKSLSRRRIGVIALPEGLTKAITHTLKDRQIPKAVLQPVVDDLSSRLRAVTGSLTKSTRHKMLHELRKREAAVELPDNNNNNSISATKHISISSLADENLHENDVDDEGADEDDVEIESPRKRSNPRLKSRKSISTTKQLQQTLLGGENVKVSELARSQVVYMSSLAAEMARENKALEFIAYGDTEVAAYIALRMPSTYSVATRVFTEIRDRDPSFKPKQILDFGSGPSTTAWAAEQVWGNHSIDRIVNVEFSLSMQETAKQMFSLATQGPKRQSAKRAGWGGKVGEKCEWLRSLPNMSLFVHPSDMIAVADQSKQQTFDLVVAGYSMCELRSIEDRLDMAKMLWDRVSEGGVLVFVEPGTPFGFGNIKMVRQKLLDTNVAECQVFAPCPHSLTCSKAAGSWCHFVQRVQRTAEQRTFKHKTSIGYEDEKFAYVVLRKREPARGIQIRDPAQESVHAYTEPASELHSPFEVKKKKRMTLREKRMVKREAKFRKIEATHNTDTQQWARVLSEPKKRGKHVVLDLCTNKGSIDTVTVGKAENKRNFAYRLGRKSAWGDLFPYY